jgi:hypothetical protein
MLALGGIGGVAIFGGTIAALISPPEAAAPGAPAATAPAVGSPASSAIGAGGAAAPASSPGNTRLGAQSGAKDGSS